MTGNILGYDLNEKNCQISFYSEEQQEPQTMEIVADNYQIPLVLGRKGDVWSFGNDAKRLGVSREGYTVSNLFVKSLLREKVSLGEETYEAVWLLAKFIELSLEKFEQIQQLVFTVPRMSVDIGKILKGIGQRIGVAKVIFMCRIIRRAFVITCFINQKNYGIMRLPYFTVIGTK